MPARTPFWDKTQISYANIAVTDVVPLVSDPASTKQSRIAELRDLLLVDYAEILCSANATSQSLTASAWTTIDQWHIDGEARQATPQQASNRIVTSSNTAKYRITLSIPRWTGTASLEHQFRVRDDATVITNFPIGSADTNSGGRGAPITMSMIVPSIGGGSLVDAQVMCGSSSTFLAIDASLEIERVAA